MTAALLKLQIVRFILVGGAAFLLHGLSVVVIVSNIEISPLIANVAGFACAFAVSYVGHKNWTFVARTQPHATALRRFVMVSLIGFVVNESGYALLLGFSSLGYGPGLIVALGAAAISTFLLSRYWAFPAEPSPDNNQADKGGGILCADDFGYSDAVSKAILKLCQLRKIRATSVMVESPRIEYYAALLEKHKHHIQIGLHFTLTESFSSEKFSLCSLVLTPRLGRSKRQRIADALDRQLEKFEALFGRSPDFVDGHRHIHIMPCVRGIFLGLMDRRYKSSRKMPWIRQVSPSLRHTDAPLKTALLKVLNIGFRARCRGHGFAYNEKFDGAYSLKPGVDYESLLQTWLHDSSGKVIMCHPSLDYRTRGFRGDEVIAKARRREYEVLKNLT